MSLKGKTVLITGAARRLGKVLALSAAQAGADVVVHYGRSHEEAEATCREIREMGRTALPLTADLSDLQQAAQLIPMATASVGPLYALVNSAAIFEPLTWDETRLEDWQRHLDLNLTAPFLISQAFARALPSIQEGRIINLLDWRALRPGADHFPYTISKAALAALTRSLAQALAPQITVNGIALGAILPAADQLTANPSADVPLPPHIPAQRWAHLEEVGQVLRFLLDGPAYVTGEIIHLDGGRHLV